jgi:Myb-like DNA-binding domain
VAAAGNRLFHPDANKGKWTSEEDEELRSYVADLGNKWVQIGARLGRPREACRVRWREIQLGSEKKSGKWSADEEERLKSAVNEYLLAKKEAEGGSSGFNNRIPTIVSMPAIDDGGGGGTTAGGGSTSRDAGTTPAALSNLDNTNPFTNTTPGSIKIDKRIVLDDIDWGVISQRVGSRSNIQCCEKWYDQLAPSMVDRGDWGMGDDRRLLKALWRAGNVAEFEVQWEGLVPERTAQQARRRWRLMVKVVPEYKEKEFSEVVEYLVSKHLPQLMVKEPRVSS